MSTKLSVKGDVNDVASVLVVATLSRTRLGNKRGDVVAASERALRNGAKGDGVAGGTFGDGVAWWSGVVAWWCGGCGRKRNRNKPFWVFDLLKNNNNKSLG